jgi:hypothetical protein
MKCLMIKQEIHWQVERPSYGHLKKILIKCICYTKKATQEKCYLSVRLTILGET